MNKVIVVVGPTSVGKTSMGIQLAKHYNGEVISGDSMQVYKGMDIGTAKADSKEMDGVIHHLIDIIDSNDNYSVQSFQSYVRNCIDDMFQRGVTPIIVGGTGLYIKAALYDYTFDGDGSNHLHMKEKYSHLDNESLFEYLKTIDPVSASDLHCNNRQRVLRAIEIFETTGITKSQTIEKQNHICMYDTCFIGLTLDRAILYDRINSRVDKMMDMGLLEEVKLLIDNGLTIDHQSMKAIGYKEWFNYFNNQATLQEVVGSIQQNSRKFAKRQYTWFKNQMDIEWFDVNLECFDETVNKVKLYIDRSF